LIALSTLMTKQHYITDILFGSVLGCFALALVLVASH
jgi:membrane-associated phospholipid phosphatase